MLKHTKLDTEATHGSFSSLLLVIVKLGQVGDLERDSPLKKSFWGERAGPDTLKIRVEVKNIWAEPLKGSQMS